MAYERKLAAVPPQAFTANGTAQGLVTIESTSGFYIKQFVNLQSDTLQPAGFQVKNILSKTQLIVGPPDNSLKAPLKPTDLSGYLVADNATISAPEQDNFPIKPDDHYLATFLPAPVSADRVMPVDPFGNLYGPDNPIPVNADVTVESVSLFTLPYDSIEASYPNPTTENYQSYTGGLSGTPVQLVVVTYTDSTKNNISSVVRTPPN